MNRSIFHRARVRSILCGALIVQVLLIAAMIHNGGLFQRVGMDYLTTYTASDMLLRGDASNLYDTRAQWEYEIPIIEAHGVRWPDRVMHPYLATPPLAILGLPFALVSPPVAFGAWAVLNVLAVVAGIACLSRWLGSDWRIATVIIVGSMPLFSALALGQVEGVLFLAFVVFLMQLRAGHDTRAGLALAVLAIKPPLLLAPLIYLAVTGRRRALLTTAIAGAVETLVSVSIIGSGGARDYVALTRRMAGQNGDAITNVWGMVNLRSAVVRAIPDGHSLAITLSIVLLTVLALAGAIWLWRSSMHDATGLPSLALLSITTVLTAYHALLHSALLALIGVVLLVIHAQQTDDRPLRDKILALSWILFSAVPFSLYLVVQTTRVPATVATVGMLLFWGAAAVALGQSRVPQTDIASEAVPPESSLTLQRYGA